MPNVESKIYDMLINDFTIASIVGQNIYPVLADENTSMPYIVYQIISEVRDYTLTTISNLERIRMQVTCWTTSYYDSIILKDAILDCLDNYSDKDSPSGEQLIEWIHLDSIGEVLDFSAGQDDSKKFGKRIDFIIDYNNNL